ncbi:MAG TPA: hypothetical protein VN703_02860 [Candidatus Sulfopaludibacter sp.]|nr:hypothetical protein [Candidatus Sulfopaludibacter sp.]
MKKNNTITKDGMLNESVEDAALKCANSDCILVTYLDVKIYSSFKKGANWQKEKNKIVIDKLIEALKDHEGNDFIVNDELIEFIETNIKQS